MKTTNQFFFVNFNCLSVMLSRKTVFFQLKANLWWQWQRLPQTYECDPIELEFIEKKNIVIPSNISIFQMFIIQWTLFISNSQELRARGCVRETVCVIYDCVGEMIFYWNHYRYRFLESVKVSKRIILQIYIRDKNKNFGKRVSCKCFKC